MSALPALRICAWLGVSAEWAWRYGVEGVGAFKIRGDQALRSKAPTMDHPMCGSGARWCARADAMFDVPRMHVLAVAVDEKDRLVVTRITQRNEGLFLRSATGPATARL